MSETVGPEDGLRVDTALERRRLRRGLNIWRVLAIVAGTAAIVILAWRLVAPGGASGLGATHLGGPHVARVTVSGVISDDPSLHEVLQEVAEDDSARAMLLYIDSPGGSAYGGEAIYRAIREVAARKPVVAVIGGLGASAGYMLALAADRIYALETSLTGSIGAIFQFADASELLADIGIRPEIIASGPLKGEPSFVKPISPEGRAVLTRIVELNEDWFVALVAERRRMPEAEVRTLADGRIFTGGQARDSGLIDTIGAEREARAWLAAERDVPEDLPLVEREWGLAPSLWLDAIAALGGKALLSERLTLDGLVAIWHPELQ